jgi:hypothetical protein
MEDDAEAEVVWPYACDVDASERTMNSGTRRNMVRRIDRVFCGAKKNAHRTLIGRLQLDLVKVSIVVIVP